MYSFVAVIANEGKNKFVNQLRLKQPRNLSFEIDQRSALLLGIDALALSFSLLLSYFANSKNEYFHY